MVKNKMLLPQELETFYIIPSIRKYLAKAMLKQGMNQIKIAKIFGVSSAALSQYESKKRAELKFEYKIIKEIEKSAKKIKTQRDYLNETQHIIKLIRTTKVICEIHRKFCVVPIGCDCKCQ